MEALRVRSGRALFQASSEVALSYRHGDFYNKHRACRRYMVVSGIRGIFFGPLISKPHKTEYSGADGGSGIGVLLPQFPSLGPRAPNPPKSQAPLP